MEPANFNAAFVTNMSVLTKKDAPKDSVEIYEKCSCRVVHKMGIQPRWFIIQNSKNTNNKKIFYAVLN